MKKFSVPPGTRLWYRGGKPAFGILGDSNFVWKGPSSLLNKKPGVYALRQDNMPCVVPDTKGIAPMPNAFTGEVKVPYVATRPRIPNAARPLSVWSLPK